MNPPEFLKKYIDQRILNVRTVEFTEEYSDNTSTPFAFLITFVDSNTFLKIELNDDADHIDLDVIPSSQLEQVMAGFTNDVWKPNDSSSKEPFVHVVNRRINKIEMAIDKPTYELNGETFTSGPDRFSGIRLHLDTDTLIIFNNGDESYVGFNSDRVPAFVDSYDWYEIKNK